MPSYLWGREEDVRNRAPSGGKGLEVPQADTGSGGVKPIPIGTSIRRPSPTSPAREHAPRGYASTLLKIVMPRAKKAAPVPTRMAQGRAMSAGV